MLGNWSVWTCLDVNWQTDHSRDDSTAMGKLFQSWLVHIQNDCERRAAHNTPPRGNGGIGSNFAWLMRDFLTALEVGRVYRPSESWRWADTIQSDTCSLHIASYDCFFEPLSHCMYSDFKPFTTEEIDTAVNALKFEDDNRDVCSIGRALKKSIQFVHAQFLAYILRPNESLRKQIDSAVSYVFDESTENKSTICVHIRGGHPDNSRVAGNIDRYMSQIDEIVNSSYQRTGKQVGMVYFASDLIHQNAISSEFMQERFPRPFSYKVLPHILDEHLEDGETELFLNWQEDSEGLEHTSKLGISRRNITTEFLIDINLLSKCDYFIGSVSSVYFLVAGLRIASNDVAYNSTCYIETHTEDQPMVCEGSAKSRRFWQGMSMGYDSEESSFIEILST